ncbi:MAG: zinc ribbon domain-containing protein [Saprospiraceae bacterium]|nr:zinc ribbon domain-containing protein [Saprospiraceae bacterium]
MNKEFCAFCFEKGEFTNPEMTVTEMQEFVKSKMKEMGFPSFHCGLFTKGIPKLNRWKKIRS